MPGTRRYLDGAEMKKNIENGKLMIDGQAIGEVRSVNFPKTKISSPIDKTAGSITATLEWKLDWVSYWKLVAYLTHFQR